MLKKSVIETRKDLAEKKISCVELLEKTLEHARKENLRLNSLNSLYPETAMKKAEEIDRKISKGEKVGRLAGIPIVVKDNICVEGMKATCSSRMLENFVSPYNATVIDKLQDEDAIIFAKANMDEFAMGSSNETSYFGAAKNPHDESRVTGGSSGGSAAAVASNQAFAALGSDTGGSIRQPAAYCGVVGLKPTYGTVSRKGAVGYASGFDQIGPITKTVADTALLMEIISGHDPMDQRSLKKTITYSDYKRESLKGVTVSYCEEFFNKIEDKEITSALYETMKRLEVLGARLSRVDVKALDYSIAAYYIISCAEAASNLARFDGVKYGFRAKEFSDTTDLYFRSRTEGFGDEVKKRIMLGNFVLSSGYYDAYYLKALKVQTLIKEEYARIFSSSQIMLTPISPTVAPKLGQKSDNPIDIYLNDIFTVPVNIAGNTAISVPVQKSKTGLPIGIQLVGNHFEERLIMGAAELLMQK